MNSLSRFYRQFYLAVMDFDFYQEIIYQPLRSSLIYLLYLSAHVAIVLTALFAWVLYPGVTRFVDWAQQNLPSIQIQNGKLHVEAEQPLVKRYKGESETWTIVFDTTGTYETGESLQEPSVLMTEEKLLLQFQGMSSTYLFKDFGDGRLTPEDLPAFQKWFKWLLFPLGGYSFWLIWTFIAKALQALLLSPLGFAVSSVYGVRMAISNSFNIALYSLAPAIVIDLAVGLTGITISYFDWIYLGVAMIYVYLATQKTVLAR